MVLVRDPSIGYGIAIDRRRLLRILDFLGSIRFFKMIELPASASLAMDDESYDLAGGAMNGIPKTVITPLRKCAVCGIGSLARASRGIKARCIDLTGVSEITHQVKECCRRTCRTRHALNCA